MMQVFLVSVLVGLAASPVSRAQKPPLVWEIVGQPINSSDLFMAGDTAVYATGREGIFVIRPGDTEWTRLIRFILNDAIYAASTGTLFAIDDGMVRSIDGGQTWESKTALDDVHAVIELPSGALVASQDGYGVARSTDEGVTWTNHGGGTPLFNALFARGFAYAPPSPLRAEGRLVTVGIGGVAYSTDEGVTWAPSSLVSMFGYRGFHVVYSAADDSLYAMINGDPGDGGGSTGPVWASTDGAVWELRGRVPTGGDESPGQIVAAPDGGLWAIIPGDINGEVFSSGDGGRTWASRGAVDGPTIIGNRIRLSVIEIGPEGRLWVGTRNTDGPEGLGVVVRSAEPVVVSAEGGPEPGKPGAELGSAYPNPTSGAVTVPLVLGEAAEVRLVVYDVLGREVAVLHAGPLAAGTHGLALDTGRLPPGVYVVRVDAGAHRFTERLTVVR